MSIKVQYGLFKDRSFQEAIQKLGRHTGFKLKQARSVTPLVKQIREADQTAKLDYTSKVQAFAVKDDKGNLVPAKNADGTPNPKSFEVIEGKSDELIKFYEDFDKTEIEIKRDKIPLEYLDGVGLSPNEIIALEPLLQDL